MQDAGHIQRVSCAASSGNAASRTPSPKSAKSRQPVAGKRSAESSSKRDHTSIIPDPVVSADGDLSCLLVAVCLDRR